MDFCLNFSFIFSLNNIVYCLKYDVYKFHKSEMIKSIPKLFDPSKYKSFLSAYGVTFQLTLSLI